MPTINPSGQTITQYNVQTGGASNLLNNVSPSAASNIPLISQGVAAHPSFGTASVAGGGTGATTLTGVLTGSGTSTIVGTAITQYNVITGGASNLPNSVAPSATSGVPVISQGAASQPVFGTAVVAGGGTGATTLTGVLTGNGTSAIVGTAITQYNVITGGASNLPNSVAPSATSGVPVISQGAASQPVFGTAVVAGGGTGLTTLTTAYGVVCAGTTATGALQNAGAGLAGQVLISNGASALPSFSQNLQYLDSKTPSGGLVLFDLSSYNSYNIYCIVTKNIFPATNAGILTLVVSNDGGATFKVAGYQSGVTSTGYNTAVSTNNNSAVAYLMTGPMHQSGGGGGTFGVYYLDTNYSFEFMLTGKGVYYNSTTNIMTGALATGGLGIGAAADIDYLKFTATGVGGLISFGTITLFGMPG